MSMKMCETLSKSFFCLSLPLGSAYILLGETAVFLARG